MHEETITFELATHFLPKIALRLEYLYRTIDQACVEVHPVIHNYALKSVIEIIMLVEKPELKSRFLKELIRIEHVLNKSKIKIPAELYNNLYTQIQILTHVAGRFGEDIHNNPFLQSIKLTQPSQSNDYEMYSPQRLLWLKSNPIIRQRDIAIWLNNLRVLYTTVNLYLSLIRNTAQFTKIDMHNGYYQRPLPSKSLCHLILLQIDKSFGIVPHMQIGHHGLSIRLSEISTMRAVRETEAKLYLALCQL